MTAPRSTTAQSRPAPAEGRHVISRKKLKEAGARRGDLEGPLDAWFRICKKAAWKSLADVRQTFSTADAVGKWTVFNIKGNQYRLITEINYRFGRVYIRHVLTHSEYDHGGWKQ
jgi:mRNA interferase HigB